MPRWIKRTAAALIAGYIGAKVSGDGSDLILYVTTVTGIYWALLK